MNMHDIYVCNIHIQTTHDICTLNCTSTCKIQIMPRNNLKFMTYSFNYHTWDYLAETWAKDTANCAERPGRRSEARRGRKIYKYIFI